MDTPYSKFIQSDTKQGKYGNILIYSLKSNVPFTLQIFEGFMPTQEHFITKSHTKIWQTVLSLILGHRWIDVVST
jgi:hypothetical protein